MNSEIEKVEVTKVANGYVITQGAVVHCVHGFDSHAALGKIVAASLGEAQLATKRKPRVSKVALKANQDEAAAH